MSPAWPPGDVAHPRTLRGFGLLHSPAEVGTLLPDPWEHPELAGDSPACSCHPPRKGQCPSAGGSHSQPELLFWIPNFPKAIRGCKVGVSWDSSPAFILTRNAPGERRLLQVWPRRGTGGGQGHEELCWLRSRG